MSRLLIRAIDDIKGEQRPVFAHMTRLAHGQKTAPAKARRPKNNQDPRLSRGLGCDVNNMVQEPGRHGNSPAQVEALVRTLLESFGRRQRRKLLDLQGR